MMRKGEYNHRVFIACPIVYCIPLTSIILSLPAATEFIRTSPASREDIGCMMGSRSDLVDAEHGTLHVWYRIIVNDT